MQETKKCLFCENEFTGHPRIFKRKACCSLKCNRNYWRKTHRDKYLNTTKEYNKHVSNTPELHKRKLICQRINFKTPKGRFNHIKSGAIHRGYSFSLTFERFMNLWGKPCHYCGTNINGVGIDRIDNTVGYELTNCVPCCKTCNVMKNTQTQEEFINRCMTISKKCYKLIGSNGTT
jgi:hypothetical protein